MRAIRAVTKRFDYSIHYIELNYDYILTDGENSGRLGLG